MSAVFASNLTLLRMRRDLTKKQLAQKANISKGLVTLLEQGKCLPRWETLIAIVEALDVRVSELICHD